MTMEHFDVLVVGAGLSGIGAAAHLRKQCPDRSFAILEGRERLGGTWDLFRYPGVRSDSDMYTLGYSFKPWEQPKAIADGASILKYIQDTAREHDLARHIRYGLQVKRASWSTADAAWTVEAERAGTNETVRLRCNFLFMCSGYYRYDAGHLPHFEGRERFGGRIVHPQFWPEDLDYANKRVLIIGSGATAVTLLPEMAKTAAHVTMLQRSPTWMVARPSEDALANRLRRWLPAKAAYAMTRWKRVLLGMYFFSLCQRKPEKVKSLLLGGVRAYLGPDYDVARHFTPHYKPWDQRLCLVPDGDFFLAIRRKKASVVTDQIDCFTETGLMLKSGEELPADLVVTATGLELKVLGGLQLSVDGQPVDLAQTVSYKAMMYSGVPNLAVSMGYTNASWTLKSDLSCEYVCRLLNHMRDQGQRQCTPTLTDASMPREPWSDFTSGYVQRAAHLFPKRGTVAPWKLKQNYIHDLLTLRYGKVDDGAMVFSSPTVRRNAQPATVA
ncbi:MAG: flavin-binding family monooxygenase [Proteobacteria bacterium]|nr:flavin-binding family monooxygenase [Pseudomonadota bacterium]